MIRPLAALAPHPRDVKLAVRAIIVSVWVRTPAFTLSQLVLKHPRARIDLPRLDPSARLGIVVDEHPIAVPGTALPVAELQAAAGRLPETGIGDCDWLALLQFRTDRPEERSVPSHARWIGGHAFLGNTVMKRMAMMVERQMNRPISRADSQGDRIVRVVALESVVVEPDDLPVAIGEPASGQTHTSVGVIVRHVLIILVGGQRILLEGQAVDALPEISLNGQRFGIHHAVTEFGDLDFRTGVGQ